MEKCVVLFASISLKMSVLFDVKAIIPFANNSLEMSVLFDVWKSEHYCLGVTLWKCQ